MPKICTGKLDIQLTISRNLLSAINIYNDLPSTTPKDYISLENTASIDHHVVYRVSSALFGNSGGDAAKAKLPPEMLHCIHIYHQTAEA